MKLATLFSPARMARNAGIAARRFPVATLFVMAWMFYMTLYIFERSIIVERINMAFQWSLWSGFGLSIAITLWCEVLKKPRLIKPLQLSTIALAVVYFIVYAMCGDGGESGFIGRCAFVSAVAAAIIFGPVRRDFNSTKALSYTTRQLGAFAFAVILSNVFGIALLIIYGTITVLFGSFNENIMMWLATAFCGFVPTITYLYLIPGRAACERASQRPDTVLANFFRTVILPIAAIYMIILYVYMAKIAIKMTLPTDSISMMVTFCTASVLITLYFMQPLNNTDSNIARIARRYMPPLLLPLIALMIIGLIYRFNQYGPTTSRVYMALFAIWATGAATYLSIRRKVHLNLLAMTFAAAFFMVSAIPGLNVSSLTNLYMQHALKKTFSDQSLPMSKEALIEALKGLPDNEADLAASRLEYLDKWNDHSAVKDIVTVNDDDRIYSYSVLRQRNESTANNPGASRYKGFVPVPEGYSSVASFDVGSYKVATHSDDDRFITFSTESGTTIKVESALLTETIGADKPAPVATAVSPDTMAIITVIRYDRPGRYTGFEGYIFTR